MNETLKNTTWYRALKILYIWSFVLSLVVANFESIDESSDVKTFVTAFLVLNSLVLIIFFAIKKSFFFILFGKKFQAEYSGGRKRITEEQIDEDDERIDKMIKEDENRYKEKLLTIELPTEKEYDSQYKYSPATISYNKADLIECLGKYSSIEKFDIVDLWKLMDAGKVAIYSEIENKMVSEIKREVFDTDFERRIRYYLPDGTRFIDIKTMSKTP